MKTIIVKTQKEFDVLKDFSDYTEIEIRSDVQIVVNRILKNATIFTYGSSQVTAYGSSQVRAFQNTVVRIETELVNILEARQFSTIIFMEKKRKVVKDKTATVIVTPRIQYDLKLFCDIYRDSVDGKFIILYKSVNPKTLCDFYTGTIKYEGTVICPDWKTDTNIQCGNGLHLSPTPEMALSYNQGKVLKCKVAIKDIAVYPLNITKVRCKKVEVLGDYK